ncbi:MAG: hypothetical protein DRP85_02555 [Candidatus Makaraimicrobium thalassicum]|nr:MAG: hypothetical protein DRP85_02555 [Candidatus Omnitrophota bacterium]
MFFHDFRFLFYSKQKTSAIGNILPQEIIHKQIPLSLLSFTQTNDKFGYMKKILWSKITLVCLIAFTGYAICLLFNTRFAKITIDYFAFLTGIFLVTEGLYKISRSKAPFLPDQFLRILRIIIGICLFTIHILQFMHVSAIYP